MPHLRNGSNLPQLRRVEPRLQLNAAVPVRRWLRCCVRRDLELQPDTVHEHQVQLLLREPDLLPVRRAPVAEQLAPAAGVSLPDWLLRERSR